MAEQGSRHSAGGAIRVRPYEERDAEQVRELVVEGWCHSKDSSLQVAMRSMWWEPICAISYSLSGLGIGLLIKSGGGPFSILCGIAVCAFPILWVKFWQRKYSKLWLDYCKETLEKGDLADIGRFYSQSKEGDNDDGGISGFWVAVITEGGQERVVGCAGLNSRGQTDKSCSELQKVSVSESYRRRGTARLLVNTVCSYARDKGLRKVMLWSTSYQANAHILYKRLGFVEVSKARLGKFWIRNGWGHTMELEL